MTRTVTVSSPASNQPRRVSTSAETWGELKNESQIRDLLVGDIEAIVNPGRITLSKDESLLPESDFQLYLLPLKNKAGVDGENPNELTPEQARSYNGEILDAIRSKASIASPEEIQQLKNLPNKR